MEHTAPPRFSQSLPLGVLNLTFLSRLLIYLS